MKLTHLTDNSLAALWKTELVLYGETVAVYCDIHMKRKLYGQNVFFFVLKLVAYAAITGLLSAKYIIYIYVYCIKTTWMMCLIILTLYVILDLVRSFEMSGYVYSMRYGDILEQRNVRISCYLYIYLHMILWRLGFLCRFTKKFKSYT